MGSCVSYFIVRDYRKREDDLDKTRHPALPPFEPQSKDGPNIFTRIASKGYH